MIPLPAIVAPANRRCARAIRSRRSARPRPALQQRNAVRRALLAWYRRAARDLPWRRTKDPYRVWLSEILLQQTRVETVLAYYERFVQAFPTVAALAAAPLERVLKLWEGLGYYTRARNLHRAARLIVREHGGRLPRTAAQWQELSGVGRYTAGAIASIASGEPVPAVDGNVQRVLARLFCVRKSIDDGATRAALWALARELLAESSPGDFNQALMELGARLCTPRRPRCDECPVQTWCQAYAAGVAERLPIRRARRPIPVVDAVVAVICRNSRYLLVRRPVDGLLGGLWTLPGREVLDGQSQVEVLRTHLRQNLGVAVAVGTQLAVIQHEFSHRRLRLHAYSCRLLGDDAARKATTARTRINSGVSRRPLPARAARWVAPDRLDDYACATVDRKLFAQLGRLPRKRKLPPS